MEFRASVRKLVPTASTAEIDQLFLNYDSDHSGELDVQEMKETFQKLQRDTAHVAKEADDVRARADALRAKTSMYSDVLQKTARYEKFREELEMVERQGVAAKIGNVIRNRG